MVLFLDSTPLGLVTHPRGAKEAKSCLQWLGRTLDAGTTVIIPEIVDYELRRVLLKQGSTKGLEKLEKLRRELKYDVITTAIMHRAAERWAWARNNGVKTADDNAIDADMILVAHVLESGCEEPVVVTSDSDLSRFVEAKRWDEL